MLPIYISYFAANTDKKYRVLPRVLAFILGFTLVFTALGLFAGALGAFLSKHQTAVNLVCGLIVILLGLNYLELIRLPFFRGRGRGRQLGGAAAAFLFGVVYSVSLTPCVGAFLGSALMLASTSGGALKGAALLLTYSLGLGVPFLCSAVLLDQLNGAFGFIKAHYRVINTVCGLFLIFTGVMMAGGWLNALLGIFS